MLTRWRKPKPIQRCPTKTKPFSILPRAAVGVPCRPRPRLGSRFAVLQERFHDHLVPSMQAGSIAHRPGGVFPVASIWDVLRGAKSTLGLHGPSVPSTPLAGGRVQSGVAPAKHRSPCRCGDGPNAGVQRHGGQSPVQPRDGGSVNGNIQRHTEALNFPVVRDGERAAGTAW